MSYFLFTSATTSDIASRLHLPLSVASGCPLQVRGTREPPLVTFQTVSTASSRESSDHILPPHLLGLNPPPSTRRQPRIPLGTLRFQAHERPPRVRGQGPLLGRAANDTKKAAVGVRQLTHHAE